MLRAFTEIEEQKRLVKALTSKSHFNDWLKWDGAMAVGTYPGNGFYTISQIHTCSLLSIASKILAALPVCSSVGGKQALVMESALSVVVMLGL